MRIIISPTKKMKVDNDQIIHSNLPNFLEKSTVLLEYIRSLDFDTLKNIWNCNDKIAQQNYERFSKMELKNNLTPAVLAYDGLAFKHMSPAVFQQDMFDYIDDNLLILSGFYGVLRAFDGVTPYRLEMQSEISVNGFKNLYDFWGDTLYNQVFDGCDTVINLASKEYYKCIQKYLKPSDKFITCVFSEKINGKIIQKATFAKMARGEMVRFMAENKVKTLDQLKGFDVLGFQYDCELSCENEFVYIKKELPR